MTNRQEAPIFVVGHPRSGSTLLTNYLGRHPDLLSTPELHYFDQSYSGFFLRRWFTLFSTQSAYKYHCEDNNRLKDLDINFEDLNNKISKDNLRTSKQILSTIFEMALQANPTKKYIVEKTPRNIEHLNKIISWYPDTKVIIILRDGRDCISSLMKAPWTHSDYQRHASYWNWSVRRSRKYQNRFPNNIHIMRYEDLITQTETTLRECLQHLNLTFDDAMLSTTSLNKDTVPEWEKNWKKASLQKADISNLYKWKNEEDQDFVKKCEDLIRDELISLNHPIMYNAEPMSKLRLPLSESDIYFTLRMFILTHIKKKKNGYRSRLIEKGES